MIRSSSASRIQALLQDLRAGDHVTREGAVARLRIIGPRAVERLAALAEDRAETTVARAAAIRALEGIGDERALETAVRVLADPDAEVATAAVSLARTFLAGTAGLRMLDTLIAVTLDRARPDDVREGALRALGDFDASTLGPIIEALLTDPSARLRSAAQGMPVAAPIAPEPSRWLDRIDEAIRPEDLEAIRRELATRGGEAPLASLLRLVERVRERERDLPPAQARRWLGVRGAAHVALAARGSRLGVYDVREALEQAVEPLPVEFLTALTLVGDRSCLEGVAKAFARTEGSDRDWWHRHLREVFRAIVARERLTRRHALVKRLEKRWPAAVRALWESD